MKPATIKNRLNLRKKTISKIESKGLKSIQGGISGTPGCSCTPVLDPFKGHTIMF